VLFCISIGPISENLKSSARRMCIRDSLDPRKLSDQTLAYLYDPDTMPEELRNAHKHLDSIVGNLFLLEIYS
jgi:hypothetical protein